ncbi:MAG: S1 RNA-binding domain-containing protein, partial [Snodgrassella sp.]|uniref:S1 RNA-binding domain-containing protein n=1 Tax=Snodgrassella sp. TaxID=2815304 RepID=UPI0025896875
VHVSALADRYIADPRDIVKAGDVVKVKVIEVDIARKRIALSMRLNDDAQAASQRNERPRRQNRKMQHKPSSADNAMAAAFARLKQ